MTKRAGEDAPSDSSIDLIARAAGFRAYDRLHAATDAQAGGRDSRWGAARDLGVAAGGRRARGDPHLLHDLAHAVAAGSRLRLLIGGVFPLIDPSPNTGGPIAPATEAPIATQTVFHDRARPSGLILPVLASVWAAAA